jgi:excisionase family DNA binding protein
MAKTATQSRRWLTQAEAAEYLNVTDRTIRALVRRGELPAYRVGARMIRIDARDLDALLKPIPAVGGDQVA